MRKTTFVKYLENATEEELRGELQTLYTKYPEIKEHYTMELGSEEDRKKIYAKAKKKLAKLYERYRTRARQTKAKEIIKGIERISVFDHELADFYLYHAEQCIDWLRYMTIDPIVWKHFMSSLSSGLELVLKSMSEDDFRDRIYQIVDLSDCGWDTQAIVIELVDSVLGDDFLVDK